MDLKDRVTNRIDKLNQWCNFKFYPSSTENGTWVPPLARYYAKVSVVFFALEYDTCFICTPISPKE